MSRKEVVVIPCSGIGKALGSVSREAAYELCETLRPDRTQLVALSKLVLGEEQARERVLKQSCRDHRRLQADVCGKVGEAQRRYDRPRGGRVRASRYWD